MSKKNLVVQHNAIIEARYKLSVGEQRLIKTLASMIGPDDEEFKPYTLRIADFATLVGVERKDYHAAVKEVAERLMARPFTLYEGGDQVTLTWFSSVRYKGGRGAVEIRFDPGMKPYLLQLKERFTKYELSNVLRLKKTYSIRMYELCKQYQSLGRRRFTIDQLRDILCLDSGYNLYADIKRRVLLDSQKELAEKTDISFDIQEIKEGRKVVAVDLVIRANASAESREQPAQAPASEAADSLAALGVARKTAEALAREHGAARIAEAVAYAEAQRQAGKLKNLAGFVVKAVKEGYRDGQAEARARKDKAARAAASEEALRKEWKALKARWEAWRMERVEGHLAALAPEAVEREKAAFRDSLAGDFGLSLLAGKSAEGEALHFRLRVAGGLPGLGLEDWARAAGVDLAPYRELARAESPGSPAGLARPKPRL
jgi:plasmid replication initiation protein